MFSAYYDESGTHVGSPITVLGGFVGSMDDWAKFDCEWRKILTKYDLRYIRAKQLFHRQGPYRGWTEKKIDHLWTDILYVLQERKELQISKIILRDEDYQSYVSYCPISRRERLDTRYALCVRCAMHFLPMVHHRTRVKGVVNFILEDGHKNAGDALRVFLEMKDRSKYEWARSIGIMTFGTKPEDTPLQAADLISYWFYKTEMDKISGDPGDDDPMDISFLERELANCGFHIIEHLITPSDLANLRLNFSAKQKKKVFGKVRSIGRADTLIADVWGTEYADLLVGAEISEEQFDPSNEVPFRRRRR
jgi:hypothetical protein